MLNPPQRRDFESMQVPKDAILRSNWGGSESNRCQIQCQKRICPLSPHLATSNCVEGGSRIGSKRALFCLAQSDLFTNTQKLNHVA